MALHERTATRPHTPCQATRHEAHEAGTTSTPVTRHEPVTTRHARHHEAGTHEAPGNRRSIPKLITLYSKATIEQMLHSDQLGSRSLTMKINIIEDQLVQDHQFQELASNPIQDQHLTLVESRSTGKINILARACLVYFISRAYTHESVHVYVQTKPEKILI